MTVRRALSVFVIVWMISVAAAVGMVFLVAAVSPDTVSGVMCAGEYRSATPDGTTYRVCVENP
ncbi:hypothetical protein [Saccharothrix sp. ALI-22-I]|uniref:hypothetical protein n=1 Tax=Saccharothrix sp. ALI-22-I TaxID=1933778 RepID=UPI00117B945E|nr:hypothetical protein [Saccharothrix sp. ALI-22-I]